jgi:hypothetical protein
LLRSHLCQFGTAPDGRRFAAPAVRPERLRGVSPALAATPLARPPATCATPALSRRLNASSSPAQVGTSVATAKHEQALLWTHLPFAQVKPRHRDQETAVIWPAYGPHCIRRDHQHGHADVIAGARRLLATRADWTRPAVGLYMVVTQHNIEQMTAMGRLAADLGMDYFVPQPISLAPGHPLRSELGLASEDVTAVTKELTYPG